MMERASDDIQKEVAASNGGSKHIYEHVEVSSTTAPVRHLRQFTAEWDDEGVYFYQAYKDEIADWAIEHQSFDGCPAFNARRMAWLKPSFAWMLYRSGYGSKLNQERVLKIKIGHEGLSRLLSSCVYGHGLGRTTGRIQWDPERDIMGSNGGIQPAKMPRQRAIQIGVARDLSKEFIKSILLIEDVTKLAHRVRDAHQILTRNPNTDAMQKLVEHLPLERPYLPYVEHDVLVRIGLAPAESGRETIDRGEAASA